MTNVEIGQLVFVVLVIKYFLKNRKAYSSRKYSIKTFFRSRFDIAYRPTFSV